MDRERYERVLDAYSLKKKNLEVLSFGDQTVIVLWMLAQEPISLKNICCVAWVRRARTHVILCFRITRSCGLSRERNCDRGFHIGTYKQEDSESVYLEASVFKALFHFIYWDPLPSIEEFFYFKRLSICSTDWYSPGRSRQLCESNLREDAAVNIVANTLACDQNSTSVSS